MKIFPITADCPALLKISYALYRRVKEMVYFGFIRDFAHRLRPPRKMIEEMSDQEGSGKRRSLILREALGNVDGR